MAPHRRTAAPLHVFGFTLIALGVILSCSTTDVVNELRQRRIGMLISGPTPTLRRPTMTIAVPTDTEAPLVQSAAVAPSDTPEPSSTATPIPTDTLQPTQTFTPRPTRTKAPPTAIPPPSLTFTPAPPPQPTRCPDEYCVVKADCLPGQNTRATGHIYENGVLKSGVRVRVSYENGGPPVANDSTSGNDPITGKPDPVKYDGYYQVGIQEGRPLDGNWWVFLIDPDENVISEGRWFKTTDVQDAHSCQIGITDFAK